MTETLDPVLPDRLAEQARRVLELACDKERMLVTAESCTGGLLAALLTDIVGLSHAFERGYVSYSDEAKCDLLAVERDKIDECGAVSKEVAVQMVRGALQRSGADVGVSITGFAGPAGDGNEEGLVHFACASADGEITAREEHFGAVGRDRVRIRALETALDMMEDALTR
jgi:nicotinamide-nucleotide amidase